MSNSVSPLLPLAMGAILALLCLFLGMRMLQLKRLIDDSPTSKTQGVFIGLTELKGAAESETPLTTHLANIKCVQYRWNVQEHWQRTVTETYTDAKGNIQTRTRVESGWTTVDSGGETKPFYLQDDTGVIRIVPDGANIENETVFDKTVGPTDPLYYGKGPRTAIANSTFRRRFEEKALPLHHALYVMGYARERQDVVAAEIAKDKNSPMFLISTRSEKQISQGFGIWYWVWIALGLIVTLGGIFIAGRVDPFPTGIGLIALSIGAVIYAAALGLAWLWIAYNSLIRVSQSVQRGWSQVEVQLKRRSDLIPNLVQAVQGYKDYENKLQTELTQMRTQTEENCNRPDGECTGLAPTLRIIAEKYPDLKANKSFLALQNSLVDTEQRIALARDYYNQVATFYNTRLEIVPDRFVAAMARLKPRTLMTAADFERAPVEVKLG